MTTRPSLVFALLLTVVMAGGCSDAASDAAAHCGAVLEEPLTAESAAAFREQYPWSREVVPHLIQPAGMTGSDSVRSFRQLAWALCMEDAGLECDSRVDGSYPGPPRDPPGGADIDVFVDNRPRIMSCGRNGGPEIQDPFGRRHWERS